MRRCIITFRSVTPAQRAEEVLRRTGVECTLQRTPKWMEEKGCGYSLQMNCEDVTAAVQLLRQAGIGYRKVYNLRESGTPEEMRL